MEIPADIIRRRSYEIWQKEGCPHGADLSHWLRARAELEAASCTTTAPPPFGPVTFVSPLPRISCPPRKSVACRIDMGNSKPARAPH